MAILTFRKVLLFLLVALVLTVVYSVDGFSQGPEDFNTEKCSPLKAPTLGAECQLGIDSSTAMISRMDTGTICFDESLRRRPGGFEILKLQGGKIEHHSVAVEDFPAGVELNVHGFDLHDGLLMGVNHAYNTGPGDRIEAFKFSRAEMKAKHVFSIVMPSNFTGTLNDVAIFDEKRIFFTTWLKKPDHIEGKAKNSLLNELENTLDFLSPVNSLYAYECRLDKKVQGKKVITFEEACHYLPETLSKMPNGLKTDRRSRLFMADSTKKRVRIFTVLSDAVVHSEDVYTQGLIDNVTYDPVREELLVAGLARAYDFVFLMAHAKAAKNHIPTKKFPAFVEKIDLKSSPLKVTTLVSGSFIDVATGAVRLGKNILVGSIFGPIQVCSVE